MSTFWPPRWRELKWGSGITSVKLDDVELKNREASIANSCRMFRKGKS